MAHEREVMPIAPRENHGLAQQLARANADAEARLRRPPAARRLGATMKWPQPGPLGTPADEACPYLSVVGPGARKAARAAEPRRCTPNRGMVIVGACPRFSHPGTLNRPRTAYEFGETTLEAPATGISAGSDRSSCGLSYRSDVQQRSSQDTRAGRRVLAVASNRSQP